VRDEANFINRIFDLVKSGKTDKEIGLQVSLPVWRIYFIRVKILCITNTGRKRICENCNRLKSITSYKSFQGRRSRYNGWCIVCRRKIGIDTYARTEESAHQSFSDIPVTEEIQCLNCDKLFYAIVVEKTPYKTCYKNRLCDLCQEQEQDRDEDSLFGEVMEI
jgi:hypothetical protein